MPEVTLPRALTTRSPGAGVLPMPGTAGDVSLTLPVAPPRRLPEWTPGRVAIAAAVLIYLLGILVLPLTALVIETAREGLGSAWQAITSAEALVALRRSLLLTAIAVTVNAVVGVGGALVLVRQRFAGRAVLDAVVDLSLAVSPVMIGLAFLLLIGRDGMARPVVEALGLRFAFAFPGLVVATLFVTLPYTIREVAHVLAELGTEDEEAAATLGASRTRTFFRVTLPNIRRGLMIGLTLTAARSLGEFGAVLVLGGAIAGRTDTATTFIYAAIEERHPAGAYGMAVLLAAISILLLVAANLTRNRSEPA